MLDELFSTPVPAAQLPLKKTDCIGGCGNVVPYRTNARVYCDGCRAERKRESGRLAAEKKRRNSGVKKVKGATLVCEACGEEFVSATGGRVKWCEPCRPGMSLLKAREASYKVDKSGNRKRVGRIESCAHCKEQFTVKQKGAFVYCEACRVLQKANKLPSLRASIAEWRRKRYRDDPKFALNDFMRNGVLKAIGKKKGGNSWNNFVDYSVDDLIRHIERQFLPGMSWENRGVNGWHIDHIRPLSQFTYESTEDREFKAAWALINLRPMWGADNIRKKDKRLFLI